MQAALAPAGPYEITVFTSPSPIRPGTVDVSVAVYRAGSTDLLQDVTVLVTTEPPIRAGREGSYPAVRSLESNTLLYGADVTVSSPGLWRFTVRASGPLGEGAVSFRDTAVVPGFLVGPLWMWVLLSLPFLYLGAFAWRSRSQPQAASGRVLDPAAGNAPAAEENDRR